MPILPQYRQNFTEIHIADIHFGVIDPVKHYNILKEQFIDKIRQIDFKILSVNGDLFDRSFLGNSDVILYANLFVRDLVDLCASKGATLIILEGTESHEKGQLKLFYHYLQSGYDIHIVEQTSFLFIKGRKILCIPEEYNKGEDYYRFFLNQLYDTVYMHGTYVGSITGANEENLNSKREPIFGKSCFTNCRGPIMAGHIHVAACLDKYVNYCGCPIRYRFGEEKPKGFLILTYSDDFKYHYIQMEEIKSFRYDSVNLDHLLMQDPNLVINELQLMKQSGIDYIRVIINMQPNENVDILKAFIKNDNRIKILMKTDAERKKEEVLTDASNFYNEYAYILEDNKPEETLVRFINHKIGETYITVEKLSKLLTMF